LEYKCDKVFHVDALIQLYDPPELCGLIFINGENCQLFTVDVTTNDKTKNGIKNTRLKQHKKGGQSSARFGRLHDEKVVCYLKEIAEEAREAFDKLSYVVIAGISKRPDQLLQYLHVDLEKKIIGITVMTTTTDFENVILPKMLEFVTIQKINSEIRLLSEFIHALETDKAIYGLKEIEEAIDQYQLSVLFISNKFDSNEAENQGIKVEKIGLSLKAQELISMYGDAFGIRWW